MSVLLMRCRSVLIVSLFLTVLVHVSAQESYYTMSQVGARSSLLNGAVIGSVRDNSAIYYNPGGLAFIDNSSLSVMGDVYYFDYLEMNNAVGDGMNVYSNSAEFTPQIFSGIIKDEKRPWLTVNYAILNKDASNTNFNAKHDVYLDVIESQEGDEMFSGTYEYSNRNREDWLGAGYGYKINDRLGLGFTVFLTYRSMQYSEKYSASVVSEHPDLSVAQVDAASGFYQKLDYRSLGLMPKIGVAYELTRLNFGFSLTTPRIPLYFMSNSTLVREEYMNIPTLLNENSQLAFRQEKIKSWYKSPWIFEAGVQFKGKNNIFYASLSYYTAIDKYNMIRPSPITNEVEKVLAPEAQQYYVVNRAHKAILNVALGYERVINEHVNFLCGFNTNFNYLDTDKLNWKFDFTPVHSIWDLYHFSGGFELEKEKFNLTTGVSFGLGGGDGLPQFVNMSTPKDSNLLQGDINQNVNTFFVRSQLVLGFTYYFPRI